MRKDPYLKIWELDLTTRQAKDIYGTLINNDFVKVVVRLIEKKKLYFDYVDWSLNEK